MSYKIIKISSYYRNFLNDYYSSNTNICELEYELQYEHLMNTKYGWSDFFKLHLEKKGVDVFEVVHNAKHLQNAWAKEHNISKDENILLSQIRYYRPDVIFFQDTKSFSGDFINHIRNIFSFVKIIFGHICAPFSKSEIQTYKNYDFILTCLPTFQNILQQNNIKTYILYHGFEKSILENLQYNKLLESDFTFIGSLFSGNNFHNQRIDYLEYILKTGIFVKLYTSIQQDSFIGLKMKQTAYLLSNLFPKLGLSFLNQQIKPLQKVAVLKEMPSKLKLHKLILDNAINKSFFGMDMYNVLFNSKIVFNAHGGVSGNYAANIRMFEATGVGSLLLTDYKDNIKDFFEPDYEIITYKTAEECADKAKWLLQNQDKAKQIAQNGQKRTLKNHNLEDRFIQVYEIINKYLNSSNT